MRFIGLIAVLVVAASIATASSADLTAAEGTTGNRRASSSPTPSGSRRLTRSMRSAASVGTSSVRSAARCSNTRSPTRSPRVPAVYVIIAPDPAQSFTAHLEGGYANLATGEAVLDGRVVDGWLKKAKVHAEFKNIACTEAPDGMLTSRNDQRRSLQEVRRLTLRPAGLAMESGRRRITSRAASIRARRRRGGAPSRAFGVELQRWNGQPRCACRRLIRSGRTTLAIRDRCAAADRRRPGRPGCRDVALGRATSRSVTGAVERIARRASDRRSPSRAHVRREHRLRPLRLSRSPTTRRRSSSSACSAAMRAASASRSPTSRPRRDAASRQRARARATPARASRRSSCCSPCLDKRLVPVVPSRGSVGASGDLAPLAHLALALIGEGEAVVDGAAPAGREALPRAGSSRSARGEGGAGAHQRHAVHDRDRRARLVARRRLAGPPTSRARCRSRRCRDRARASIAAIHAARPHPGQVASAANLRRLLDGSAIIESHRCCDKVQDAYSLRCIAAGARRGPRRARLRRAQVAIEINAATDNPLVLARRARLVSDGNFHGQPVAFALDCLAIAVAELANISERRIERLVNPNLSDGLPAFLTERRRPQLGVHDRAVHGGGARLREQGAGAPGERRLDPDVGRPGGSRLDGHAAGLKALAVLANVGARAGDRAARRRPGLEFLAPLGPGRGGRWRRGPVRTLRRACARTARCRPTSSGSRRRSGTARARCGRGRGRSAV